MEKGIYLDPKSKLEVNERHPDNQSWHNIKSMTAKTALLTLLVISNINPVHKENYRPIDPQSYSNSYDYSPTKKRPRVPEGCFRDGAGYKCLVDLDSKNPENES